MKSAILSLLLLAVSPSFAATVTDLTVGENTASATTLVDTKLTIFGGSSGICASSTPESVCDSCSSVNTLTTPQICNTRSVFGTLKLHLNFTVDAIPSGATILIKDESDNTVTVIEKTPDGSLAPNTALYAKITWDSICVAKTGAGCTVTPFSTVLKIGVTTTASQTEFSAYKEFTVKYRTGDVGAVYHSDGFTNELCQIAGEGFCEFSVYPGDEKVYIEGLKRESTGPGDASGILWSAARIYYAPTAAVDFTQLAPATASFKDLVLKDKSVVDSGIEPSFVDGLTNDQLYMFTMATVDEAGNVGYFSDPATFLQANYHSTAPGEIVGLLDDKSCFIATAAFGSSQDPYVMILRQFRDKFLKTNSVGLQFVEFYYEHSPKIAQFIAQHETLRTVVRALLWPVIGVANASLTFGLGAVALLMMALTSAAVMVVRRRRGGV